MPADVSGEKCRLLTSAATGSDKSGAMGSRGIGTPYPIAVPLGFGFADLETDEAADGDVVTEFLADASDMVAD